MAKGYEKYNPNFPGKMGADFRAQVRNPDAKPKAFTREDQNFIKSEQMAHELVNKVVQQLKEQHPEKSQREIATIARRELPAWLWKLLPITTILTLILSACATAAGTPDPELPTQSGPQATEVGGTQAIESPTEGITEQPTEDIMLSTISTSLQQDPDYDNVYVQYLNEQNEQPLTQEGVDFLNDIGTNGKGIVADQYVSIGVNSYGILYAEHVDGGLFVFNIKDSAGSYLIATKQEAFDRLLAENPSAVAGKSIDDFTLTTDVMNGVLLSLIDETGKPVEGINAQTRQWSAIDDNGVLVGGPAAVPTETIGAETSDAGLLEADSETISAMVNDFASGAIEFPSDMTREQYNAFIDGMNDKVGRKSIWVETDNGNVLYFDIKKNRMISLPGTYEQNKDVIEQNQIELFVKINEEPGTGNIQFVNPDGELITSPNSADVDWNLVVDASNYNSGIIDFPTPVGVDKTDGWFDKVIGGVNASENGAKVTKVLNLGILMDDTVSDLVSFQNGWNQYPCLDVMFIRTDKNGNPIYGVRTMVGPAPAVYTGEEGGTIDISAAGRPELRDDRGIKQFEEGAVYYVGLPKNQQILWDEFNKADIDALQGVGPESSGYDNAVDGVMPDDGNIVVAGSIFIKKK